MKSKYEIFLDTDIFTQHLSAADRKTKRAPESLLVRSLKLFSSFTSVFNVSEVLAACTTREMSENALKAFYGINVLGVPYRYAPVIGDALRYIKKKI